MNKPDQAPKPTPKPMSLDNMMRELAAGLKDTINETSSDYLKKDPEDDFVDLACRLVFRLRATLTVVPVPSPEERIKIAYAEAAQRIFDILTEWMRGHPDRSYSTKISASGKFQIVVRRRGGTQLFFGETAQDAYAQAAQTVSFDEDA